MPSIRPYPFVLERFKVLFAIFFNVLAIGCDGVIEVEMQPEPVITRSCVNLINESDIIVGSFLLSDGIVSKDKSKKHVVTQYLPLVVGTDWYQRTAFFHACCMRDSCYGFYSDCISFYDGEKNFLEQVVNPSCAILIPERAAYARVQYSSSDSEFYAAVTNRRVLSPYSKYRRSLLTEEEDSQFISVQNSEGAITRVLRTGYDYLDRGLGYGCLHTAYNTECIKSLSYDGSYSGERYQIDCSSFVELAITGVPFENSRYYQENDNNIPLQGSYVFDSFTEYNYYMIGFPEESGADYGRLYANKIAKYFYDRGLLYGVEPDFSNVRVGDLLFWKSYESSSGFFKNIGHVAICSDSWPRKSGGQGIRVLETASENIKEYSGQICYGARVDLPFLESNEIEYVSSFSNIGSEVIINNSEELISTVFLSSCLEERELYTLVLKCEIPHNTIIVCKVNNVTVGCADFDEVVSPDGIIVKHFGITKKELGMFNDRIEVFACSKTPVRGKVIIKEASLSPGYYINNLAI